MNNILKLTQLRACIYDKLIKKYKKIIFKSKTSSSPVYNRFTHLYHTLVSISHISSRSYRFHYHHLPSPSSITTYAGQCLQINSEVEIQMHLQIRTRGRHLLYQCVHIPVRLFIFCPSIISNLFKTLVLLSYTQKILDSQYPLTILDSQNPLYAWKIASFAPETS